MTVIEDLVIRKVLDSRGDPAVEVDVHTASGFGRFSAPSGASTGVHESVAYPEGSVDLAMERFEGEVIPRIMGMDSVYQEEVDNALQEADGTVNFSVLGANVAVATSIAVAKAAASSLDLPLYRYLGGTVANRLPNPFGNILGGGRHAPGATVIQEFLCVALGPTVRDSIMANALAHRKLGETLRKRFRDLPVAKGDEGAWAAPLQDEEALALVAEVCQAVEDQVGFQCRPALDLAASEFFRKGKYHYKEKSLTPEDQVAFVVSLVDRFNLYSVEDPLEQDDFKGFSRLTEEVGDKCLVIGDDLFVTNVDRIRKGAEVGACNAVLIKPNQIGTLTSTWRATDYAHQRGYETILSHRSGETVDEALAHLAVAFRCGGIKAGTVGGERISKLNELMRIEEELT